LKTVAIVNSTARKGGAGRRWPAIQAELARRLGPFETRYTEAPGHAIALARTALAEGARRIVAVGGDGTVSEALNGLLDQAGRLRESDAVLCPVPAGTANTLCRALGYLDPPSRAYDAVSSQARRRIDLLRVRCAGLDGQPVERFGCLLVSVGGVATIGYRTSQSRWVKKLGGIAYRLMMPVVAWNYAPRGMAISIDGVQRGGRRMLTAMVANSEYGGGVRLMPGARFDDGVLDLIEVGDISWLSLLVRILPRLNSGAYLRHPKVQTSRGASFRFESEVDTLITLDGEVIGHLPLEVSVLPGAFLVGGQGC
jgi:diacylglycerol kinase family enzyme